MQLFGWIFPLISGLLGGSSRAVIKYSRISMLALLCWSSLASLPIYLAWMLFYEGIPQVETAFWWILAVQLILKIPAAILTVEGQRISPLTVGTPYASLTPVFTLLTYPLMLGIWLNIWGMTGVVISVTGVILASNGDGLSFKAKWRNLLADKGSMYILAAALIYSFTSNLDLLAFRASNASWYMAAESALTWLIFLSIVLTRQPGKAEKEFKFTDLKALLTFGLLTAFSNLFQLVSLHYSSVPYILAGKRVGMIFSGMVLGLASLAVKSWKIHAAEEWENLRWRLGGAAAMLAGMLIIIYYGK